MTTSLYPIDEIRARCDLVEVVSAYVALRKSGRSMLGLCPFHNEKTPSFTVNPERQAWKCFGCGEGGDVFSFVQKIEKCTFPEAVEQLARRAGITIQRTEAAARQISERDRLLAANSAACAFFRAALKASPAVLDYLAKRGVSEQTAEKYRLGYAPDSWDSLAKHLMDRSVRIQDAVKAGLLVARERGDGCYDRFRHRLMFPILDNSERVIAFGGRAMGDDPAKYLNSPETPLFVKNRTLYGLNFARRAIVERDCVIVVEGYFDAMTTQEAGFENTVATMGTALTEEHVNVISRFTKNVVLAFDADSAGINAALRSWPMFEHAGFNVRVAAMPEGEDPDSLLRGGDTAKFARLVEKAVPIPDYRIGLLLESADLQTDSGRTAALRSASAIIAEVDSPVERERLIRSVARYHPNFRTGTTLAEDHVRGEVSQLRSRMRKATRPARPASGEEQPGRGRNIRPSLITQSEKLLLGILILKGGDVSKVFGLLPPNQFMYEPARLLAEALCEQMQEEQQIDQDRLRTRVMGTAAEGLLTDILVGLDDSELNHSVDDLVNSIIRRKKFEQRLRMRELAAKIQEGAIRKGDEEFEEYWKLVQESSGPWRR